MVVSKVDPNSTRPEHLASVDVKFSGAHIGGGIYFSANHQPSPGGGSNAIPQRSLVGEAEKHAATEYDYTLPAGGAPWTAYWDDLDGDGTVDFVKAGFDMSLHVGDPLAGTGAYYDGPSVPLLIANDPTELSGAALVTGYPSAENAPEGVGGVLYESAGTLSEFGYTQQSVNGDTGGYFTITGAEALGGMSGGGTFLQYDVDGDGFTETYLIGSVARTGTFLNTTTFSIDTFVQSTAFAPHYAHLADTIEGLSGAAARDADDFGRMVLLSAQRAGSTLTTVQGEFFHEDIYGGVNNDTLLGAGGDDLIHGRDGADYLDGGSGMDTIDGGSGADTIYGGAGADLFLSSGLGGGAIDVIVDFDEAEGDVIDLSAFFATLDDVVSATIDLGDGSILIALPPASGGGAVQVLDTSISDLTALSVNVVCFTSGTMIETPDGARAIETLQPGDLVSTYGGAVRPLSAVTARRLGADELSNRPSLWPVTIRAGALGPGVPSSDLTVSPQHRILLNSHIAERMTGGDALVAAKRLLDLEGVSQPVPTRGCTYIHLVFAGHEIVRANGCYSESFYPGPEAMKSLPDALRREYERIFGHPDHRRPAAVLAPGRMSRRMVWRHLKNNKPFQSDKTRPARRAMTPAACAENGAGRGLGADDGLAARG